MVPQPGEVFEQLVNSIVSSIQVRFQLSSWTSIFYSRLVNIGV